ncbi:hypothetical protein B0H11DRAFT_2013059 [Mycena galericulata]|nr:hypothetical protein B0H11DRAFT_2013059 [Mycena galericulata]
MVFRTLFVSLPASSVTGSNTGFGTIPIPRTEASAPHSSDAFAHHRTPAYASHSHTPACGHNIKHFEHDQCSRTPDNFIIVGPSRSGATKSVSTSSEVSTFKPLSSARALVLHDLAFNMDLSPL